MSGCLGSCTVTVDTYIVSRGQRVLDVVGLSHLVTLIFGNGEGEQEVHVLVVSMVVVNTCSCTLVVVDMTVVVNVHDCLAVLGSAVILWNTVVVAVHILVGQVLITGVSVSETNSSNAL